jgi:ubiquinone/menaquinone biosynthesis C-methylase UbiE
MKMFRVLCFAAVFSAGLLPGQIVFAQSGSGQPAQRPTSTPYAGDLSIFEYPGRDQKLEINRVMDLLHIQPGKSVADLGAGSGWFTVRAARRVGAGGMVFAEDISPAALKYIHDRALREKLGNIREVLDQPGTMNLPPNSVDAVLMLKAYHEFAQPVPLMRMLHQALKPGARIGIIDRNGNGSGTDHGVLQATVEREMGEAGYRRVAVYDFTKKDGQDYFLIFEAKP